VPVGARSAAVALLRHPILILCLKITLQFAIMDPNKVLLPTILLLTNKRKFYLCAFALKKKRSLFFSS
jgi:hypothetical protein